MWTMTGVARNGRDENRGKRKERRENRKERNRGEGGYTPIVDRLKACNP